MSCDCDDLRAEVARLRYELHELVRTVGRITQNPPAVDHRLAPLLARIHAFAFETQWTAGELLADASRAAPDLWRALDAIAGPDASAIRLGRWLERHDGVEIDGYRLQRVKREGNAWLYSVKVESGESSGLTLLEMRGAMGNHR